VIAIIGGGISGLALAHELASRGRPFVLLESAARAGGVIRSGRVDGHVLEWGPQRARLTPTFAQLVTDLDLGSQLITAPRDLPLYVFRNGALRRVPFTARDFLASDILSWRGRLRLLLEPFTTAARDDETVADLLTRKLGREAYENLAGPLYGGLYASDPEQMVVGLSLRHALRELGVRRSILLPLLARGDMAAAPAACSFRDGMEALPRALYRRHAANIRLDTSARTLERDGSGWVVRTDTERIAAEHVVLTTAAAASARLLRDAAPAAAERIGALHYNPLTVVHLHAETALRGLGYQVSFAEPLVTRGVTWNDALFGRKHVYTAYLGGAQNPWIALEPGQRAGDLAVAEFRTVTSCEARVLSIAQEKMPAWDRSWSALQSLDLPRNLHIHANWYARPGIAGRLSVAAQLAEQLAGP
jgi:oxygen-dependent protoporphyrinogen oxidase